MLTNPKTGKYDPVVISLVFLVVVCGIKFLLDGVTFHWLGHLVNLGHVDSLSYAALLAPIMAGHSYMNVKGDKFPKRDKVVKEE